MSLPDENPQPPEPSVEIAISRNYRFIIFYFALLFLTFFFIFIAVRSWQQIIMGYSVAGVAAREFVDDPPEQCKPCEPLIDPSVYRMHVFLETPYTTLQVDMQGPQVVDPPIAVHELLQSLEQADQRASKMKLPRYYITYSNSGTGCTAGPIITSSNTSDWIFPITSNIVAGIFSGLCVLVLIDPCKAFIKSMLGC